MIMMLFLAVGCFGQLPATNAEPPIITNYWRYLTDILEKEEVKAKLQQRPMSGVRFPPPREFPFEALRDLAPKDLVRAAKEGIQQAQRKAEDQPEAIAMQMVNANIQTALEYYSLLAENDKDLDPLLYAMASENEEPSLRLFLVKRCVPGLAPASLFSLYFQHALQFYQPRLKDILTRILEQDFESAQMKLVALDAMYWCVGFGYEKALAADTNFAAFAQQQGKAVSAALLPLPGAPQPNRETQTQLTICQSELQRYIGLLAKQLSNGNASMTEVRQKSRDILEKLRTDFPLPDPAVVQELLQKNPPE